MSTALQTSLSVAVLEEKQIHIVVTYTYKHICTHTSISDHVPTTEKNVKKNLHVQ